MNKKNKNEIRLLIEHWKEIISEENIVFEEVLNILLEEEKYLNEIASGKKAMLIASLVFLLRSSSNVSCIGSALCSFLVSGFDPYESFLGPNPAFLNHLRSVDVDIPSSSAILVNL